MASPGDLTGCAQPYKGPPFVPIFNYPRINVVVAVEQSWSSEREDRACPLRTLSAISISPLTDLPSTLPSSFSTQSTPLRLFRQFSSLIFCHMSRPEIQDYDLPQGDRRPPINFSILTLSNQDRNGSSRLSMSQKPFPPFVPRPVVHTDSFPRHTQDTFIGTHPTSLLNPRVLPLPPVNGTLYNQMPPNQQSTPNFFAQPTSRLPSSSSFHLPKESPPSFLPYNDTYISRKTPPGNSQATSPQPSIDTTSTLLWDDLEPWMDEEYAKQVCMIMHWDPISVKVPKPPTDPASGPPPNNRGYCYLTFSNSAKAAATLSQIIHGPKPTIMPNSTKPFSLHWATSVPATPPVPAPVPVYIPSNPYPTQQPHQFTKEYSIFVGDLAPEVSNSDLVAVFRNPVLGLRNDREPRFIRPFLSCKSAKIMLDPATGVSRGYGFVRSVYLSSSTRLSLA